MIQNVEISKFDLRYESYRMKNVRNEGELLVSISEHGILEPLQGVDSDERLILLNGFKRYRCARKLGIGIVPYSSLGSDEAFGIIQLIRIANSRSLTMLEQARLIDELRDTHKMSVSEIATLLEKSKSWVCTRIGIIGEMSARVMEKIFRGEFPVYSYLYSLRKFRRINGIKNDEIEEFVQSVSGRNLSVREIELLAHGYFHGSLEFREQIKGGDIAWGLNRMKEHTQRSSMCTTYERGMLKDLEILHKYMQRITYNSKKGRLKTNSFYAQANLLADGIIRNMQPFSESIKELYDRSGKT